ncbi:hypothetical protein AB0D37_32275 [Streptomyces sp. NPDC048384]|uniref:hypothetical protein n=1 Tax=unclassified Streptomyces TaxID=2593676 RepID=UPI00342B4BCE
MEQLGHDDQHKAVVQGGENDSLLAVQALDRSDDVTASVPVPKQILHYWITELMKATALMRPASKALSANVVLVTRSTGPAPA